VSTTVLLTAKLKNPSKPINTNQQKKGELCQNMVKLNKTDKLVIDALKSGELTLQQIADKTGEKPKKTFKSLRKLFENELVTTNARKYKLLDAAEGSEKK
jgi:predicted transcriptional regulator